MPTDSYQVIDTPGILDHSLEERNTIEMQAITALAHLRACILYVMDLSEQVWARCILLDLAVKYCSLPQISMAFFCYSSPSLQCGYKFEEQVSLFENIRPLFLNKPLVLVVNKVDTVSLEDVEPEKRAVLARYESQGIALMTMSTLTGQGVVDVKNKACETLLAHRVEMKASTGRIHDVLNRLHLAMPKPRDAKVGGKQERERER